MALLCHFFLLRTNGEHTLACANFVAYSKANAISKTGKRADNFRSKWVMMDARCIHSQLALPKEPPSLTKGGLARSLPMTGRSWCWRR